MTVQNQRIFITGANSGIGKQAALALAKQGAEIILACRNASKAQQAMSEIRHQVPSAKLEFVTLDLASLDSIRACAEQCQKRFDRIDILINNAGLTSLTRQETEDGFELTMGVNHLGPFLLTHLLLPLIRRARQGRIINVASDSHYQGRINFDDFHMKKRYFVMKAYAASKIANVYFTQELAERLEPFGITVNALHPGVVATNIWPNQKLWQKPIAWAIKKFMISEDEGAETTIYLANSEAVNRVTGKYFFEKKPKPPSKRCLDRDVQKRLWDLSETLTGLNQEPELLIAER